MSVEAGPGMSNRAIYSAALELTEPALRQAYLDEVCGDDVARRVQIEQLLAAREIAQTNPLDKVIQQVGPEDTLASEPSGGKRSSFSSPPIVDRYKIREQIGEGGMGVVYVAEQTSPVRRKVALKIIKPGMNSKDVIARFEAERQALALMDHPNIARVLDAATMDDGRPYFVMELVMGVPLTEFCDDAKLTNRARLELFIDVCSAVQHAHQKGIIHRDLKPSNIMVTMNDDRPMPKVIDFGIAKALSQPLTDHSIYTAYGQMVGTPVYMSPEQAQLNATDVDTRSDVYSLGVLLYELLTGSTPFDKVTLQSSGFDEMRRLIREVDPPRPSQRISTLKADLSSTISGRRSADPRTLSRLLVGELDWIVMRALEKDRKRRYQSPRDLAEDIQRYLDGEAVDAFPPSIAYRLTKTMHKHRAALFSLSLLLLGLLAAIVGTSWQAVRATRAERQSENRLATLEIEQGKTRDALSKAKSAEQEQRRLRLDAEAYAHRERAAAELQRELKESSELAERDAKWNLYVARLFPMQTAFKDRDYGRLDTLLEDSVPSESDPDYRSWEWYYLKERVDTNSMKLTLDHGKVHGPVAWNPVAEQFATFCSPTFIDIWNADSLSHLRRIDCQVSATKIEWSPSGNMIAAGSAGCELSVVDAGDGAIVWRGRPVSVPNQDIAQVFWGLSWNPDGHRIAVANRVGEIAVVDINADTTVIVRKPESDDLCGYLDWHPDGNRLALGLRYGERTILDLRDFSQVQLEHLSLEIGVAIAWSPSGALLATSEGSKIRIADQQGQTQFELMGHVGNVVCLEWSDDSTLVSSSQDRTIRVWSSANGQLLDTIKIVDAPVDHMALDAKGQRLVCGTTGGELRICRMFAAPRQHVSRLVTGDRSEATEAALDASSAKNSIVELKWSPDGVRLAAAGEICHGSTVGGSCGIWNSASLRPINASQTGLCKGLDWSTDGTQLLRAAVGDQMRAVDFRTGRTVDAIPCPLFGDPFALWSPSKRWVVSHGKHAPILRDGTSFEALVDYWDKTVIAQGNEIAWSPSERYFVAGGWGVPVLCQLDGRSLRCPDLLSLNSFGIDWHPSEEVIAFGGRTGKIVLRDRHKLDALAVRNGHTSDVTGIDFSPDGRRLASASHDGTVRIWDFASGAELLQLTVEGVSGFSQVAWSPDGLQLAAGTTVRQVVVWGSHKVQPTPATATSIESGPVIKAIESQLGFPLDWNRNAPKLAWRDPLTTLEECAGGFEEPIDRDRFDGLIEKALSEGNPAKDDHDSLVRAWLVLIEAHRDANSAAFLVDRLCHFMERFPSEAAAEEQ